MSQQTFYFTNQTPQIQNKFNGTVWQQLENGIRGILTESDTVYVATGPVYKTVGGNESITYLPGASGARPASLAVANYYWKALLKVKWGTKNGQQVVTNASAIGFWFEHKEYNKGDSDYAYATHACKVSEIEAKTGLDLFANLPHGRGQRLLGQFQEFLSDSISSGILHKISSISGRKTKNRTPSPWPGEGYPIGIAMFAMPCIAW